MTRHGARAGRFVRLLRLVALLFVVLATVWFVRGVVANHAMTRKTVIVASSPVALWSWDASERTFVVVVFPADTAVDAVGGYGRYSLASLWKLGFIDKRAGNLLRETVGNAIALPVAWFIGRDRESLPVASDPVGYGKTLFSYRGVGDVLLGKVATNVPVSSLISFAWNLARSRPDDITVYDLAKRPVTVGETLADGSTQQVLDMQQLDVVLQGIFEDEEVRREGLAIAVYNTTATPFVGSQAARVIANQGGLVVAVGNELPERDTCVIQGQKAIEKSKTVGLLMNLLSCSFEQVSEEGRADVLIKLGTAYAKTFTSGSLPTH